MPTVQELIIELQKIEDKNKPVKVFGRLSHCYETDFDIEDYKDSVILEG